MKLSISDDLDAMHSELEVYQTEVQRLRYQLEIAEEDRDKYKEWAYYYKHRFYNTAEGLEHQRLKEEILND